MDAIRCDSGGNVQDVTCVLSVGVFFVCFLFMTFGCFVASDCPKISHSCTSAIQSLRLIVINIAKWSCLPLLSPEIYQPANSVSQTHG